MFTPLGNRVRQLSVIMPSTAPFRKRKDSVDTERAARTHTVLHASAQTLSLVNTAQNKHSDAQHNDVRDCRRRQVRSQILSTFHPDLSSLGYVERMSRS